MPAWTVYFILMVKTENLEYTDMHAQFSLFLWFKQKNKNTE